MTWKRVRDVVLFAVGVLGIAYETVIKRPPDYALLPLFGGMAGLPAFLNRNEATKTGADDEPH